MKELPQKVSDTVRKLNPHLYGGGDTPTLYVAGTSLAPPKRIRQRTKPLMDKLEQEWFETLCVQRQPLFAQAMTFKLANGVNYTPDVFSFDWESPAELSRPTAWEVKGDWFPDDARVKVKMFASAYPQIRVILAWKDEAGAWQTQRVLP